MAHRHHPLQRLLNLYPCQRRIVSNFEYYKDKHEWSAEFGFNLRVPIETPYIMQNVDLTNNKFIIDNYEVFAEEARVPGFHHHFLVDNSKLPDEVFPIWRWDGSKGIFNFFFENRRVTIESLNLKCSCEYEGLEAHRCLVGLIPTMPRVEVVNIRNKCVAVDAFMFFKDRTLINWEGSISEGCKLFLEHHQPYQVYDVKLDPSPAHRETRTQIRRAIKTFRSDWCVDIETEEVGSRLAFYNTGLTTKDFVSQTTPLRYFRLWGELIECVAFRKTHLEMIIYEWDGIVAVEAYHRYTAHEHYLLKLFENFEI